ncbi:LysM domain-containing protein [Penicillium chrysogenum]|uniref:LysM domain-containing protein n=1 Tax=Penicillium chrysogenum TaxID=5076 RepID=A0ABQ8W6K0_PENCH|nr:LysM domain-containing protein [Penicillium chrysogenum]KAJ6151920.1 LysM domain-containing protein [Penicillium chrysogenum]
MQHVFEPRAHGDLHKLQKDVYYCVQAVGDITTYSGHAGSTSDRFSKVSMTSVPSSASRPDFAGALKNNSIPAIPLAKDSRKDCYDYIWMNNITDNALADCWTMAMTIDVPKEDFIMWNPSLEKNATGYNYPCTLQSSSSYCVQLSKPTNTQTTRVQSPSSVAASSTQSPKSTTHA